MYFLAVDHGCYDGWELIGFSSVKEVIDALKLGRTGGEPFKILKEIELSLKDESVV